jgi:hypothetical protein
MDRLNFLALPEQKLVSPQQSPFKLRFVERKHAISIRLRQYPHSKDTFRRRESAWDPRSLQASKIKLKLVAVFQIEKTLACEAA